MALDTAEGMGLGAEPHLFCGTMAYQDDSRYGPEDIKKVIMNNLKAGIRHIDTAEMYETSLPYIKQALAETRVKRDQIFICSKLRGMPAGNYAAVKARVKDHLETLGIEYLDLLLMHWPGLEEADLSLDAEQVIPMMSWNVFDTRIDKAWSNIAKLKEEGLTRRVGVSNFYRQHLARLQTTPAVTDCPPVVNQIYLDATHHHLEFVDAMQRAGIHVMAYRPLTFLPALKIASEMGGTAYKQWEELKQEVSASAKEEFKTMEQFVIASLLARGVSVCVKSSNYNHIRDNMNAIRKAKVIPDDLKEKLPAQTEMSTMMLAYDVYAEIFQNA